MITDKAIEPSAAIRLQSISVPITTALSQTNLAAASVVPGYQFEVEKVEVWASAVTATISVNVLIGSTTILTGAITPVATTITNGSLVAARSGRRGTPTSALNVQYTTNGTGAATNLRVTIWIRPYPLNGEA